jgi:predicted dehydrogenase
MKRLAMVGDEIIHDFIFPAYLNGFDPALMERYGRWMASLFRDESPVPMDPSIRVVAIASPATELAEQIAAVCGMETVVAQASDLPQDLDGVLVMERLGPKHLPMARPFFRRGNVVFVDKPITETLADWQEMKALALEHGVLLHGGSSLGHSGKLQAARERILAAPGTSVVLTGPGPWYEYACHLVAAAVAIFGPQIRAIAGHGNMARGVASLEWESGGLATLQWGPHPGGFRVDAYTPEGHEVSFIDDPKTYYRGLAQSLVTGIQQNVSGNLDEQEAVISVLDTVGRGLADA